MEAKHNNHQDHAAHEESSEAESHHSGNHMDVFDCIRTRRSVRKYKDKQVPWDNIVEILQAAKFAPFAGNVFNCKFVVIKNEDKRKAIAETCAQQYWMQDAPVHIVIVCEVQKTRQFYGERGERFYSIQNCAAAAQNMLLAAHAQDLGSCWVGSFDEDMLRKTCGIPEYIRPQAVIALGYAAETPESQDKYRLYDIVHIEGWDAKIKDPKWVLKEHAWSVENKLKRQAKKMQKV